MNMCKKKGVSEVTYMKRGNLYTCKNDTTVRMCVEATSGTYTKLIMVSLKTGALMSSLGGAPTIKPAFYTDVTDQYCLSKV